MILKELLYYANLLATEMCYYGKNAKVFMKSVEHMKWKWCIIRVVGDAFAVKWMNKMLNDIKHVMYVDKYIYRHTYSVIGNNRKQRFCDHNQKWSMYSVEAHGLLNFRLGNGKWMYAMWSMYIHATILHNSYVDKRNMNFFF